MLYDIVSISMHGLKSRAVFLKFVNSLLKQYEFLNEIPPGFSPTERFFRQWPRVTGVIEGCIPARSRLKWLERLLLNRDRL